MGHAPGMLAGAALAALGVGLASAGVVWVGVVLGALGGLLQVRFADDYLALVALRSRAALWMIRAMVGVALPVNALSWWLGPGGSPDAATWWSDPASAVLGVGLGGGGALVLMVAALRPRRAPVMRSEGRE